MTGPAMELLDTAEAAEYLGVSKHTLASWRRQRPPRGPRYVLLGRRVLYWLTELDAYLDDPCTPHSRREK